MAVAARSLLRRGALASLAAPQRTLMPAAFLSSAARRRTPNTSVILTTCLAARRAAAVSAAGSDAAAAADEAAIGDRAELAVTTLEEGRAFFFYKPRVRLLCCLCARVCVLCDSGGGGRERTHLPTHTKK